ncbi:MAG: hypothetical protein R3Y10_11395 [Ferrimonas sp.]
MSNSNTQLSVAQRALLVSAMLGGGASVAKHWSAYQQGEMTASTLARTALRQAAQAGVAGGVATAIGTRMAGRPLLSLATIALGGAAVLCVMDERKARQEHASYE